MLAVLIVSQFSHMLGVVIAVPILIKNAVVNVFILLFQVYKVFFKYDFSHLGRLYFASSPRSLACTPRWLRKVKVRHNAKRFLLHTLQIVSVG